MFGRNKTRQATTTTAASNTNTTNCTHEGYSGYREGDFLVCSCNTCNHSWTRRVAR